MELKKSTQKNLENKKNLFFTVGLVVALSATLVAFEWDTPSREPSLVELTHTDGIEWADIPITLHEPPPAPIEAPQMQLITDIINLDEGATTDFNVAVDVDPTTFNPNDYFYSRPADTEPEEEVEEAPIPIGNMQDKPTFQSKDANAFVAWVYKQIVYPEAAVENNIQGMVYVNFVIGKTGELSNIEVIRSADPLLSTEVIRIVKLSPKWEPGRVKGRAVNVSYSMPIRFKLQ